MSSAEDELQAAFGRRIRDASDLERLHLAVDECKRVGLNVHTAVARREMGGDEMG